MEMPNKLILAVIKQPNSYNSWWYEVIPAATFERADNGFSGSLENVKAYYSDQHHDTEVHAFELIKNNEWVEEGLSGADCETYSLQASYEVKGMNESVVLEFHEDMDSNIGFDVVSELGAFPTLADEDEFDITSI